MKKNISKPLYKQVADWISNNIQNERWQVGSKIPSEDNLATELNISRGTARKAIALLIEKQLLIQIQGKGTYVKEDAKISYPFAQELISYAESMEIKGYRFNTEVIKKDIIRPQASIQRKLSLKNNDYVFYLKRLRSIENEPAILLENWISLKHCKNIYKEDFQKNNLFQAIEKHVDTEIAYGVRDFSAISLDATQANILGLKESDSVLKLNQTIYDNNNSPIECSVVLLRTDKYKITSILNR